MRWVLLVQHGEAKPEQEDPARPLTERGRSDVEATAEVLARLGIGVERIIHSGKTRARQTAEIMATHLNPKGGVEEFSEMAPLDDPGKVIQKIEESEAVMLCGHLPHLSRLASRLLVGEDEKEIVRFVMGGCVCIVHEPERGWRLAWAITPEQAAKLLR